MITAKVIADTKSSTGRITSLELLYPRFILAELNTHRAFSRSSASSRAIPVLKMLSEIEIIPVVPIHIGQNQPGMQADAEISRPDAAVQVWLSACKQAVSHARILAQMGVHKQVANRLVEPFAHARTIVTATDWENFFNLRLHPDAQPEMRALAQAMRDAIDQSVPRQDTLHVPYVDPELDMPIHEAMMCSAARCARVSYANHVNGKVDVDADMRLARKLADAGHLSPFEHQATALSGRHANFNGWRQFRSEMQ